MTRGSSGPATSCRDTPLQRSGHDPIRADRAGHQRFLRRHARFRDRHRVPGAHDRAGPRRDRAHRARSVVDPPKRERAPGARRRWPARVPLRVANPWRAGARPPRPRRPKTGGSRCRTWSEQSSRSRRTPQRIVIDRASTAQELAAASSAALPRAADAFTRLATLFDDVSFSGNRGHPHRVEDAGALDARITSDAPAPIELSTDGLGPARRRHRIERRRRSADRHLGRWRMSAQTDVAIRGTRSATGPGVLARAGGLARSSALWVVAAIVVLIAAIVTVLVQGGENTSRLHYESTEDSGGRAFVEVLRDHGRDLTTTESLGEAGAAVDAGETVAIYAADWTLSDPAIEDLSARAAASGARIVLIGTRAAGRGLDRCPALRLPQRGCGCAPVAPRSELRGGHQEHRGQRAPRGHRGRILLDELRARGFDLLLRRGLGRRRPARRVRTGPPRRRRRDPHRHGLHAVVPRTARSPRRGTCRSSRASWAPTNR